MLTSYADLLDTWPCEDWDKEDALYTDELSLSYVLLMDEKWRPGVVPFVQLIGLEGIVSYESWRQRGSCEVLSET